MHTSHDTAHGQLTELSEGIVSGVLWEMLELITQERIAVGSSNSVEGMTM